MGGVSGAGAAIRDNFQKKINSRRVTRKKKRRGKRYVNETAQQLSNTDGVCDGAKLSCVLQPEKKKKNYPSPQNEDKQWGYNNNQTIPYCTVLVCNFSPPRLSPPFISVSAQGQMCQKQLTTIEKRM